MESRSKQELARLKAMYDESAREYYLSLPIEDTIDTVPQANSRKIVLSSFSIIKVKRPDMHCFNELLIEYTGSDGKPARVVPSNFIVVYPEPIKADNSFDISKQPARPLLALEYLTELRRPEFHQNREKYERELRIPYYLRVYPHEARFEVFSLRDSQYLEMQPSAAGRCAIPELELEVGMIEGLPRLWFRGEVVPTIAELWKQRNEALAELEAERQLESLYAEAAKLRKELAKLKGQS